MELRANEIVLRQARANHLRQYEGVGGRLFLTNQRLFFKPHLFNVQTNEASIPLENITAIRTPHSDLLSAKLAIKLTNNFIEFFVVRKRKDWLKEIETAVTEIKRSKGESWHNSEEVNEEIVHASRAVLFHLIIGATVIGILTGVMMFLFL
jgi:hypothetical protein